jgi:hypothetical protein
MGMALGCRAGRAGEGDPPQSHHNRQSGLRGAFISAKSKQGLEIMRDRLARLRRCLGLSFNPPHNATRKEKP